MTTAQVRHRSIFVQEGRLFRLKQAAKETIISSTNFTAILVNAQLLGFNSQQVVGHLNDEEEENQHSDSDQGIGQHGTKSITSGPCLRPASCVGAHRQNEQNAFAYCLFHSYLFINEVVFSTLKLLTGFSKTPQI